MTSVLKITVIIIIITFVAGNLPVIKQTLSYTKSSCYMYAVGLSTTTRYDTVEINVCSKADGMASLI